MMNVLLTIVFLCGIAALAYGSWLVYEPAGFLVGGTFAVLVPIVYARGGWVSSTG